MMADKKKILPVKVASRKTGKKDESKTKKLTSNTAKADRTIKEQLGRGLREADRNVRGAYMSKGEFESGGRNTRNEEAARITRHADKASLVKRGMACGGAVRKSSGGMLRRGKVRK